jgi:hypothetical protein
MVLGLLPSACQDSRADESQPYLPTAAELESCGGAALLPLIGQPVALLPEAGGWSALRVIRPGMAVTMDYSESRLNVELGASDEIVRLSCG